MKVSFDFDGTLSRKDVQDFAKELIGKGIDVWIVTSRIATEQNDELYKVAESVGVVKDKIVFTEHIDKIVFLKDKGFEFHLDDDEHELILIMQSKDSCVPLNVGHFSWKENCLEVLNK